MNFFIGILLLPSLFSRMAEGVKRVIALPAAGGLFFFQKLARFGDLFPRSVGFPADLQQLPVIPARGRRIAGQPRRASRSVEPVQPIRRRGEVARYCSSAPAGLPSSTKRS